MRLPCQRVLSVPFIGIGIECRRISWSTRQQASSQPGQASLGLDRQGEGRVRWVPRVGGAFFSQVSVPLHVPLGASLDGVLDYIILGPGHIMETAP